MRPRMNEETSARKPRGAFFGRRRGHALRKGQASLINNVLPDLSLDLSKPAPKNFRSLFDVSIRSVRLEIGFGGGENLLHEAKQDPDVGFVGCDPYLNGMAKLLASIRAEGIKNIRLHHGDALELLDWLPERSLDRIDILYPDPWPKRRHWKRRFISDDRVSRLARVLMQDGCVRFATDIASYAEWGLLRFLRSPLFTWKAEQADDWRIAWPGYTGTRYEAKAIREGRRPIYLMFQRI
jgi:tRNA (guanine-N7-)-methyltransferase